AEVRGLSGSMIFRGPAAILALLLAVATGTAGCAFNHIPDMKAQIGKLPIPSSYQVLGEETDYINPKFFGLSDILVSRYYRSPLDFERTCDDLEGAFTVSEDPYYHRDQYQCVIHFLHVPSGWRAAFLSSYSVLISVFNVPAKGVRFGRPAWQPPDAFT